MTTGAVMMLIFAVVVLGCGLGFCLNIALKNQ
ncbi:MAG: MetS family NSS transporter small subunit [Bacillota bacterium]